MQPNGYLHRSPSLQQADEQAISLRCLARIVPLPRIGRQLWAAVTWTSSIQDSLYLLASWWALCFQFHFVSIYILPLIWIGFLFYMSEFREDKHDEKRLQQALETLRGIESLELLWRFKDNRQSLLISVYAYIGWVVAQQFATTQHIILATGTLALVWQSPWMKTIRQILPTSFVHSFFMGVFIGPLQSADVEDAISRRRSLAQRVEDFQREKMQYNAPTSVFEFVLYENQRSWPLTGWRAATIPFLDRAPWTDPAKKPLAPKGDFQLPETIQTQSGAWTWTWTDTDWRLASKSETDVLGWTYGTLLWSVFDRQSKGWMSTRYRRWARTAALTSDRVRPTPPPRIDTMSRGILSPASPASPNPSLMSRGRRFPSSVRFSSSNVTEHDNDSVVTTSTTSTNTTIKKKLWSSNSSASSTRPPSEHKRDSVWRSIARVKHNN
ncbi:integral peroxisomal membrane peroxin-domain-containing protein [Fennellomyces sp. T-0311]|nr:integral peroxisomal membrane peroxin-domain-containing protein [Fennellomyces sp. T-0311]